MIDKKIENKKLRERFISYYNSNFNPNMTVICRSIGITHFDFYKWKNGKLDYGVTNLSKIKKFLDSVE